MIRHIGMLLFLTMLMTSQSSATSELPVYASLGGQLTLTDMHNQPASLLDWRGKVVILTFGFTACPHICPTILMELGKLYGALGDAASQVQIVFISIDPKRDTPEQLRTYLSAFPGNMLGLTGSDAQLQQVARAFGAVFNDQGEVLHSDRIYLLDAQGQVRQVYVREGQFAQMQQHVRQLLPQTVRPQRGFCDRLPSSLAFFCHQWRVS